MAASRSAAVDSVIRQYGHSWYRRCGEAAEEVRGQLETVLRGYPIKCAVSSRAKDGVSLKQKLLGRKRGRDQLPLGALLPKLGTALDENRIKDLAGARVSLYFPSDWAFVEQAVFDQFTNVTVKTHPEPGRTRPTRKRFDGYAARHYYVDSLPSHGLRVEIQVASALMHAWMEVEHDLVYKPRRRPLDAEERATLDGVNGLAMAGDILLDGLKLHLLGRKLITTPKRQRRVALGMEAMGRCRYEFVAIGQNLFTLMIGETKAGAKDAKAFGNALIRRLREQEELRVTFIVADPYCKEQVEELAYGFPLFEKHLKRSIAAMKTLRERAARAGVGDRLAVGTAQNVQAESVILTDAAHRQGMAYLTYTSLGSRTKHRPIVTVAKKKHPDRFHQIDCEYRWRRGAVAGGFKPLDL